MTYCIAMRLDAGMVFLADSRTNAGVDQISTYRKLTVFEHRGERLMVLMSAGNLAIAQAVRQIVCERVSPEERSVWNVGSMNEAVRVVGDAIREVHQRDAAALKESGVEFNCSFIFGGQIRGGPMRLFHLYAAGNFIEATPENLYFQIGESKYGKPIVDRILRMNTPLGEGAKCALVSMDSTLRSNISVGMPLDLLVYEVDSFAVTKFVRVDAENPYMSMIRNNWGARLRQVFDSIPNPAWQDDPVAAGSPVLEVDHIEPVRAPLPALHESSNRARGSSTMPSGTLTAQLPTMVANAPAHFPAKNPTTPEA